MEHGQKEEIAITQHDVLARGQTRNLEEQRAVIQHARERGQDTAELVVEVLVGVAKALANEFADKKLILRLLPEDIVYDPSLREYAVAADVERYGQSRELPSLTLLDNGIYAPELTGQVSRPLSARTSVYNLAALLYYTITGLEPVDGFSSLGHHLPPVRIFEPDMPLGIDPILRKALARLPEERFSDPAALLEALGAVIKLNGLRLFAHPEVPLTIRYAAATHPGINKGDKNPQNQDQLFSAYDPALGLGLFLVADGVSTCSFGSGDRAAEKVVETAKAVWEELVLGLKPGTAPALFEDKLLIARLTEIFSRANQVVVQAAEATYPGQITEGASIMSSTVVAAFLNGRRVVIGNVGDSRVYLIREGLIDQVTVDMDRRTTLLRQGERLEAIMNVSGLGQLSANIGRFSATDAGQGIRPARVEAAYTALNLLAGDRVLVCSDGLPDCIGKDAEERIYEITLASQRPSQISWELLTAANQGGGDDNITVIVINCTGKEDASCPTS